MSFTEWFSKLNPGNRYADHEALFRGLEKLEHAAVLQLQLQSISFIRKIVRGYGVKADKVDEIVNQSTLIFLRKIEQGAYQFQGNAPSTYLIEIAKRVALMATRQKDINAEPIENHHDLFDPETEVGVLRSEAAELVELLLSQIGEPCRTVIRLYHIEGFSDEEVIKQKLTPYSTTDSLKMKRSDCMKKLVQIALQWKILNNT
ncbi:MAG: hypothetical protein JNJ57_10510 [Saprospiraceae bacterium]|nr:hypothetical protein [Saprospiraceae bacterium]